MKKTIIDPFFYSDSVHLIGAVKDGEAEALILHWLSASDGETTFLGHPSRPFKALYVAPNDTQESLDRKLKSVGIDAARINAVTIDKKNTLAALERAIAKDVEVVVIADVGALINHKLQSHPRVLKLMPGLRALAAKRNLTIIGLTQATKSYVGRERIAGIGLWSSLAGTVVIQDPGSTPDNVKATIIPLNAKPKVIEVSLPPSVAEVDPV